MNKVNRRVFLQKSALLSAATIATLKSNSVLANNQLVSSVTSPSGKADIKVGCTSWAFHGFKSAESPMNSIEILGEMGFDGVELIINDPQDLKSFWTEQLISDIRIRLDKYKMEVSQLAMFQPVVEDLSSLNYDKRMKALDNFEAGTVIAKKLGANIVNIVAPWPRELSRPGGGYLPRYYDIVDPKVGQKYELLMDSSFDWDKIWEQYLSTTKDCLERVKKHNMRFTIEHHSSCIVSDANSFLLLKNNIQDKALGYNLDVGWTQVQREYPPVAINKVKDSLYNLHMRDIDGAMRKFVHIGEGVMDFAGIVRELKKIGFKGYVSLEQDKHPGDMKMTCRKYLDLMRKLIAES